MDAVPAAEGSELDMLEFANERKETSRLTCQLTIQDNMDGMVLRLPESQY